MHINANLNMLDNLFPDRNMWQISTPLSTTQLDSKINL